MLVAAAAGKEQQLRRKRRERRDTHPPGDTRGGRKEEKSDMLNLDLRNLPKITNKVYYPLYKNKSRYLVLYGGAGSGKSVFAAQKIIFRLLTEQGHKVLVVRKVAKTLRQSTFSLLRQTILDWGMQDLFKINKGDMEIICLINGNSIIHAGLDDVEKMKSIHGVTMVWIEEASELLQGDFQQLDLRLRGRTKNYKQIIFSFNPISITHWLKKVFFDKGKKNSKVFHTTYLDNEFIDKNYIDVLESLKEQDPYYYEVYALGRWGVLGKTVFPARIVNERIDYLFKNVKPLKQGYFEFVYEDEKIKENTITWFDDPNGPIKIYETPKEGHPYIVGGDTAGDGSDFFVGQVLNNHTGNQAAVLHHQFDEDLYARQMYCLGKYFNDAMLSIEANYSTYPVKELSRLGYENQYMRETEDSITNKPIKKLGFNTNKITRPLIIAHLVKIVRDHIDLFNDIKTLEEMLTFARNEQGKPEALEGSHDDLIMGLAIGHYTRPQQVMEVTQQKKEIKGYYTETELEDMGFNQYQIKQLREGMKSWK